MKIEYQVTSIELSKKIRELGVKKESLFYWANYKIVSNNEIEFLSSDKNHIVLTTDVYNYFPDEYINEIYSAFTASELLEILPFYISYKNLPIVSLYIEKTKIGSTNNFVGYYVAYKSTNFVLGENYLYHCDLKSIANFFEKNLVDACAKMLIYVIENKILEF